MILSAYNYVIVHIPGADNVWADILTRWGSTTIPEGERIPHISALLQAPLAPTLDPDFTWPRPIDIHRAQDECVKLGHEQPPDKLENTLYTHDSEFGSHQTLSNSSYAFALLFIVDAEGTAALRQLFNMSPRKFSGKTCKQTSSLSVTPAIIVSQQQAASEFLAPWLMLYMRISRMNSFISTSYSWVSAILVQNTL